MPRLIAAVLTAILLIYPIGIYFALHYFEPRYIGFVLLVLLAMRYLFSNVPMSVTNKKATANKVRHIGSLLPITVASGLLCVLVAVFNDSTLIRVNPVLINVILLLTFAYTLFSPPSMIERFARLTVDELPDEAVPYTRNVTKLWCSFFIINGSIAFYTCFYTSLEIWALYNGLIAYVLMGILFMLEYAYRQFRIKAVT